MNFFDAIKYNIKNYATFSGRAPRSAYWYWQLFCVIVWGGLYVIDFRLGAAFFIASIIPSLAAAVRRLHDVGKSGWALLCVYVPGLFVAVMQLVSVHFEERAFKASGMAAMPLAHIARVIGLSAIVLEIPAIVYAGVIIWWMCKKGEPDGNDFGPVFAIQRSSPIGAG